MTTLEDVNDFAEQMLLDFKRSDKIVAAYPMVSDSKLAKFVAGWRTLGAELIVTEVEDIEELDECSWSEKWDWLWQFCVWDSYKIARMSGVSSTEIFFVFDRAKSFRLVYPDGTIADSALATLEALMAEELAAGNSGNGSGAGANNSGGWVA